MTKQEVMTFFPFTRMVEHRIFEREMQIDMEESARIEEHKESISRMLNRAGVDLSQVQWDNAKATLDGIAITGAGSPYHASTKCDKCGKESHEQVWHPGELLDRAANLYEWLHTHKMTCGQPQPPKKETLRERAELEVMVSEAAGAFDVHCANTHALRGIGLALLALVDAINNNEGVPF